jgi:hypothetical protein
MLSAPTTRYSHIALFLLSDPVAVFVSGAESRVESGGRGAGVQIR